jgi:hypothetical protein
MGTYSAGDIFFIIFILCVIHGIMLALGYVRRRKAKRTSKGEAE